jgi:hypothetical protein
VNQFAQQQQQPSYLNPSNNPYYANSVVGDLSRYHPSLMLAAEQQQQQQQQLQQANYFNQKQPTPGSTTPIDYMNQMMLSNFYNTNNNENNRQQQQQQQQFNPNLNNGGYNNQQLQQLHQQQQQHRSVYPQQQPQPQPQIQHQQQQQQQPEIFAASGNTNTESLALMDMQNYQTGFTEFQEPSRIVWSGPFTIKNDTAQVGMNYAAGNLDVARLCLAQMSADCQGAPLRITQRMRLEYSQLEGVHRKLLVSFFYPEKTTFLLN